MQFKLLVRFRKEIKKYLLNSGNIKKINFIGISPTQMISIATALIPFLEHNDANRALMGSNMQRQALPLINAKCPIVGTGLELQTARDSSATIIAKESGFIIQVDCGNIIIRNFTKLNKIQYLTNKNFWKKFQSTIRYQLDLKMFHQLI